jgi:hypothetical protein
VRFRNGITVLLIDTIGVCSPTQSRRSMTGRRSLFKQFLWCLCPVLGHLGGNLITRAKVQLLQEVGDVLVYGALGKH